jgi:hypothetical protein
MIVGLLLINWVIGELITLSLLLIVDEIMVTGIDRSHQLLEGAKLIGHLCVKG